MDENFTKSINFEKMEALIITKQVNRIDEVITLEVGSENFQIQVTERDVVENPLDNHKKGGVLRAREEEASSEKELVLKSVPEASTDGSRRDGVVEVFATDLENE
ncbi:hypothetical protein J1N35_033070 [Gossypium stocksii]|uniref:Uncharacterized protein n=1 Tax=Gossypium stocksii TaxID=47602 RepID=A0A9D3UPG6_9ROSI|nr:hypothetical protein J1N35_033070 [Gossypium stocksii]